MNLEEKIRIAQALEQLGVDVIEAGFAIASKGDFAAVQAVAKEVKEAVVCSLARARKEDIEAAAEAIKPAKRPRIHTFLATSPIHMEHKLHMDQEQVLAHIRESVSYARQFTDDVDWSPEGATRSEHDFLCRAIETAIACGATTINIPDTVGYTTPQECFDLFTMLKNRVPNIENAVLSIHCHNDLGLATANSLAAVEAGARQVECTINGIGERAGNTALEEVVMALQTRRDRMPYSTGIDSTQIMRTSRLVSHITGFAVQNNKSIVGKNAFAHESGIHQDGMLKNKGTYEIMTPESIGLHASELVLGKHSGRAALKDKLRELGITLGDNAFAEIFARFKALADKKKEIYDDDILALVDDQAMSHGETVTFGSLRVECGSIGAQMATLELHVEGKKQVATEVGDGPVDAAFSCIRTLVPHQARLKLYQVQAVTEGIDAQATVMVRLETPEGVLINGSAADVDTIVASVQAYLHALNKLRRYQARIQAQPPGGI